MEMSIGTPSNGAAHDGPQARSRLPRVVVLTPEGDTVDVTGAAAHLLRWARALRRAPEDAHAACAAGPQPACPPEWAPLCRYAGPCGMGCTFPAKAGSARPSAATSAKPRPFACPVLTRREAEVAALLRRGCTNKEIGQQLGIQEDTVKKHLQAVYGKLGVHRRALVAIGGAG